MITKSLRTIAASLAVLFAATTAHAEDGVTDKEIKVGMANALSGPASGLGTQVKAGAEAYIAKVNAAGGVNGRKITLVSLDDGYEPEKSIAATKKLLEEDKVFTLFGYVGTPTSTAVVPLANKAGTPYLFPFTGAEFLRNPVGKWVFNLRASYFDETEAMVERLTKDLGAQKIALFIQDDAFGEAGKAGVNRALNKRSMKVAEEARYKRNTLDVDEGIAKMKAAQPDAIVFVGTYKPLAAIVKKAKAAGIKAKFVTVSFIGTMDFIKEAGADGDGVYITQVMPSPDDASVGLVKQYKADMKGDPGYTSLEGYANAVVLVEALKKAGASLTRASFTAALESLNTDIGGLQVGFSGSKHQGSSQVFLTQVKGGKAVSISKF
ncbi:MAG: ABC transporter substrate-binding protein [Betaproteobacteria bacterium]|nr:ABC transporter substrate-binding protein [Betaproteobacteria bacterium]